MAYRGATGPMHRRARQAVTPSPLIALCASHPRFESPLFAAPTVPESLLFCSVDFSNSTRSQSPSHPHRPRSVFPTAAALPIRPRTCRRTPRWRRPADRLLALRSGCRGHSRLVQSGAVAIGPSTPNNNSPFAHSPRPILMVRRAAAQPRSSSTQQPLRTRLRHRWPHAPDLFANA
jgi:hypothetical protein